MTLPLRQQMQADLPVAMRERDTARVSVLRITLAAVANAEAVDASGRTSNAGLFADVARKRLSDDDIRGIVQQERDELRASADELRGLGQAVRADELATQARLLDSYLAL